MTDVVKVLYPGTFDPPTLGHLELIQRASSLFDHLIVGVGKNLSKKTFLLTVSERLEVLTKETQHLPNVTIEAFEGLTVEFAHSMGAKALIRGLRGINDIDAERQMAAANWKLTKMETIFFMAKEKESSISSTLIRELARAKAPLSPYVPKYVEDLLHKRTQEGK